MKYTNFSYSVTCVCGKRFFIVFQEWGRIEQIDPELNLLCFSCSNHNQPLPTLNQLNKKKYHTGRK